MSRKLTFIAIFLILLLMEACASVPKPPHHVQYGVFPTIDPAGFYGVDSETHEHIYEPFLSREMAGAQCLTHEDYLSMQSYVQELIDIAKQRCK